MKTNLKYISTALAACMSLGMIQSASADKPESEDYPSICDEISWGDFTAAVEVAYAATEDYGLGAAGIEVGMWATLMDITGKVCYVYSVDDGGANGGYDAGNAAWLGSRVISAQKANTANAFSLDSFSIPTGAISAAVYPGGSLYGLQHSNPVDTEVAYEGSAERYGTAQDPMEGERVGGVNVFGGGVALYDGGVKIGAIGVSGDTSCRDSTMAFMLRHSLGLDDTPNDDSMIINDPPSALFEHPSCGAGEAAAVDVPNTGFVSP